MKVNILLADWKTLPSGDVQYLQISTGEDEELLDFPGFTFAHEEEVLARSAVRSYLTKMFGMERTSFTFVSLEHDECGNTFLFYGIDVSFIKVAIQDTSGIAQNAWILEAEIAENDAIAAHAMRIFRESTLTQRKEIHRQMTDFFSKN